MPQNKSDIETASVKMWNKHVGVVGWSAKENICVFSYTQEFKNSGLDISPIHMPINSPNNEFSFPALHPVTYQRLPGLLADSLPDQYGSKLLQKWNE